MNKFCTILSLSLSIVCFAYMFNESISISCLIGIGALILSTVERPIKQARLFTT